MSHSSSSFSDDQQDLATVRQADGRTLRKSCDRCYQQKLRCVGDKTSLTRCMRCQRAGVECVYSVRSSKPPNKNGNDAWDNGRTQPVTPPLNPLSDLETVFDPDLLHLDDIFPSLPWSWATADTASPASFAPPPSQNAGTSEASMSTAGPFSTSPTATEAAVEPMDRPSDLSGRLANICQALEATFAKVIRDHTNRAAQDYPIGEVFSAFDGLLRVLALDDMVAISTSRTPQTPLDEYLRSKQASIAAQCYILCIRLMVSLSEQMLQSLLASPLPTPPRSAFANLGTSETTQNANVLGAQEGTISNTSHIPENLTLGDLYVPPTDPFGHALNSTTNVLQIGSRLLGRMEQLLGIPPELGGGGMSSVPSKAQARIDRHLKPSLPARFVASIWEDEASMNNKSAVTYFRRCRAAILGLTKHHS